jgi:hypothetical protein
MDAAELFGCRSGDVFPDSNELIEALIEGEVSID